MATENRGWFYAKFPERDGRLLPATEIFELRALPALGALADGKLRVRPKWIAVAPMAKTYLELPGNDTGAEDLGLRRTALGEPVPSECIFEVVESRSAEFVQGDLTWGMGPLFAFRDLAADGSDAGGMRPMKLLPGVKPEAMLSVVTPSAGITAYCAVEHSLCGRVDPPAEERTMLVTSAAGAVGLVLGQLYKLKGCRVIGVTSTREKADQLVRFGAYDAAIAYRSEDLDARMAELAPQGFDVFVDNVGAEQLDAGARHMKVGGKILSVGAIGEVDRMISGDVHGWKEYLRVPARELTFGGFLMYNHFDQIVGAFAALSRMLAEGKLKSAETLVRGGFERWAECVDRVYASQTFGRLILAID